MPPAKPWAVERVMEKVNITQDCWEWAGTRNPNGYGVVRIGGRAGKTHLVHRWLDEQRNGPIPPGIGVLHHCDNPPCVNPKHLWRGTHAENMRDMDNKGRCRRRRSLTDEQIIAIYQSDDLLARLARKYKTSTSTIRAIQSGLTYSNLTGDLWKERPPRSSRRSVPRAWRDEHHRLNVLTYVSGNSKGGTGRASESLGRCSCGEVWDTPSSAYEVREQWRIHSDRAYFEQGRRT